MTLTEWAKKPEVKHKLVYAGLEMGVHDVNSIQPIRYELWNLTDYFVSAVQAGMIWLVPKDITK